MNSLGPRAFLLLFVCGWAAAAAPENPEARKVYDHNYKWLSQFPTNFIVTNVRGENDSQYPERRQAALDLLRKQHDITTVPELMDELARRSFLSGDICDTLGEWRAKKALPLLREVSADKKRPRAVRHKAADAVKLISTSVAEAPAPSRPSY